MNSEERAPTRLLCHPLTCAALLLQPISSYVPNERSIGGQQFDTIVTSVQDIQVTGTVDCNTGWLAEV